ncbi:MAG: CHAT domain-containing tetratricopeptide repeat protein [Gemmataceae bacterium]
MRPEGRGTIILVALWLGLLNNVMSRQPGAVQDAIARAQFYRDRSEKAKAIEEYSRAIKLAEATYGADSDTVADVLNSQGRLLTDVGQYAKAEPVFLRSLRILEARLGPDHLSVASCLNNLALLYEATGQYARAEPLYLRSLKIKETRLSSNDLSIATSLNNLGQLYKAMGQYAKAEPLYLRSLTIREARLGPYDPAVARLINNLAFLYVSMNQPARAEPLYLRSIAIKESRLGPDDPTVATSLNNLAVLYKSTGQFAKAEPLYLRSLKIGETKLGPDDPSVATSLNNLAGLYEAMGQYAKAEPLYLRSLRIRESRLGPDHPDVATSLSNLAQVYAGAGRPIDAAAVMQRSRTSARHFVARTLPTLPDAQQAEFLKARESGGAQKSLSLGLANIGNDAIAAQSATWLANSKASAHEANAEAARVARSRDDPQLGAKSRRLADLRGQLAALTTDPPKPGMEARRLAQMQELGRAEAEVAADLGRAGLTGLRAEPWVALDEIRDALAAETTLIDIARFEVWRFGREAGVERWQPARYAAWLTPKTGPVKLIDLGPAAAIDRASATLRKSLAEAPQVIRTRGEPDAELELRTHLDALAKLVLHPLLRAAGSGTRWIVSPDADLWLVPWPALTMPDGKYAAESLQISFAVSARDPVYTKQTAAAAISTGAPLVIADPDFDTGTGAIRKPTSAADTHALSAVLGRVRPLPGTATEAQAVLSTLRRFAGGAEPRIAMSHAATESVVKQTPRPHSLVLSTHGFFLPDQVLRQSEGLLQDSGDGSRGPVLTTDGKPWENPLLRCGLLLAGCNREPLAGSDDGVLTGLEVAGLDLRGCNLVVLSACETGLGDVRNGEGVSGLRQAFQLAGARSVVATLWQVPDRDSAKLMTAFFDNLALGKGKAESLRAAQLGQIANRRQRNAAAHPFFWAAYTLTGQ